ncbi:MAG: GNAT family N-acetyltransferase [Candidatus Margulisbacteria bacterium]|nr:GNAT family N-acetyltransferase [Candidatus Margulisiibacteriota bacterium]
MLDTKNIQIIKLSDPEQIQEIFYLRKEVFQKENKYSSTELYIPEDNLATHFLLQVNDQPAGCVSIFIDYGRESLPMEKHLSLKKYKHLKNAEVYKLALLTEYRNRGLWLYLAGNTYSYLKSQKVNNVFITVSTAQKDLFTFYSSLGFKKIANYKNPLKGQSSLMLADLSSKSIKIITKKYEKRLKNNFVIIRKQTG